MADKNLYTFENLLHRGNAPESQPPGTYRDMWDGKILEHSPGQYSWEPRSGSKLSFRLPERYGLTGHGIIKEGYHVVFLVDKATGTTCKIGLVTFDEYRIGTYTEKYSNATLGFGTDYPIEARGYYESATKIWVHWIQNGQQPRAINLGVDNSALDPDMLNYSPEVVWPVIDYKGEITGNLLHGTYFIFAQYISANGIRTDHSPITKQILLTADARGTILTDYPKYQGDRADKNTYKGLTVSLTGIDTRYSEIVIGYFYSNDQEVYSNGVIVGEYTIAGATLDVDIQSMIGIDTVLLEDVLLFSQMIQEARAIEFIKGYNTLGHVTTMQELDLPSSMAGAKASSWKQEIVADMSGFVLPNFPLAYHDIGTLDNILPGIWYKATGVINIHSERILLGTPHPNNSTVDDIYLETVHTWGAALFVNDAIEIQYSVNGQVYFHSTTIASYTLPANYVTLTVSVPAFDHLLSYRIILLAEGYAFGAGNIFMFDSEINVGAGVKQALLRIKKYYDYVAGNQVYEDHIIEDDYLDYKGTMVANKCGTYKATDTVPIAIVFFNLAGKPFAARTCGTAIFPEKGTTYQPLRGYTWNANEWYQNYNYMANTIILNDIDITSIKDEISGYIIVRAPVNRKSISEGVLIPTLDAATFVIHHPKLIDTTGAYWFENVYKVITPEYLFGLRDNKITVDDDIELIGYLTTEAPFLVVPTIDAPAGEWIDKGLQHGWEMNALYAKGYRFMTRVGVNTHGAIGYRIGLEQVHDVKVDDEITGFDTRNPTFEYNNSSRFIQIAPGVYGIGAGGRGQLIRTKGNEINNPINDVANTRSHITLIRQVSSLIDPADPEFAPSSVTQYTACGNFVPLTAVMITAMNDGGTYKLNHVQVWGGDCFCGLFDVVHMFPDETVAGHKPMGLTYIFPIESQVNVTMRTGNTASRDWIYENTVGVNLTGLRWATGGFKLEEFNYNDAYSSSEITKGGYVGLPYNYREDELVPYTYVWSEKKTFGELYDSYRRFLIANKQVIDPTRGHIVAHNKIGNYLIIFKEYGITYVPIGERILVSGGEGMEVQLGAGTEFARYDDKDNYFGTQNKFSIIETKHGHLFIDVRRMAICILTGGQTVEISIAQDLREVLYDRLQNFVNVDSPFEEKGIAVNYDRRNDIVLITFFDSVDPFTLEYNVDKKRFIGFQSRKVIASINYDKDFHVNPGMSHIQGDRFFLDDQEEESKYYETDEFTPYIELSLNKDSSVTKIFDNLEFIKDGAGPNAITVITKDFQKTSNYYSTNKVRLDRRTDISRNRLHVTLKSNNRLKPRGGYIILQVQDKKYVPGYGIIGSLTPAIIRNAELDNTVASGTTTLIEIIAVNGNVLTLSTLPESAINIKYDWFVQSLDPADYNVADPGYTGDYTVQDKIVSFDFDNNKITLISATGFTTGKNICIYSPWSNFEFLPGQTAAGAISILGVGWRELYVSSGPCWYNESTGLYMLLVNGRSNAPEHGTIGFAYSSDLITWTIGNTDTPIILNADHVNFTTHVIAEGNIVNIGGGRIAFTATGFNGANRYCHIIEMDKDCSDIVISGSVLTGATWYSSGLCYFNDNYVIITMKSSGGALETWTVEMWSSINLTSGYLKTCDVYTTEYDANDSVWLEGHSDSFCPFVENDILYCMISGTSRYLMSATRGNRVNGLMVYDPDTLTWSILNNFAPEFIFPMYFYNIPSEDYDWAGGHQGGYASFLKVNNECYYFCSFLYVADTYQIGVLKLKNYTEFVNPYLGDKFKLHAINVGTRKES